MAETVTRRQKLGPTPPSKPSSSKVVPIAIADNDPSNRTTIAPIGITNKESKTLLVKSEGRSLNGADTELVTEHKVRRDRKGKIIDRVVKWQQVTFRDEVTNAHVADIEIVESYKQYNYPKMPKKGSCECILL